MPELKTEYKIPQAKELKMGMYDAYALSMYLEHLDEKYNFDEKDYAEVKKWQKLLEPKDIA